MSDNEHLLRLDELRAPMNIHDANDEEIYAARRNRVDPECSRDIYRGNSVIECYRNNVLPALLVKFSRARGAIILSRSFSLSPAAPPPACANRRKMKFKRKVRLILKIYASLRATINVS